MWFADFDRRLRQPFIANSGFLDRDRDTFDLKRRGAAALKAVAHLSDGTIQDVTAATQWTLSIPGLATVSNGTLTAAAAGTFTVQAAYLETTPAGNSPASAGTSPET